MKKVEIKREDLDYNLNSINNLIKENNHNPLIIAVVKANGMGLDLVEYTKYLISKGINFFAVATFDEAIELRDAGINEQLLLLSPVFNKDEIRLLIEKDVTLTIGSEKELNNLIEVSSSLNKPVGVHIKIDSGFGRYGFLYNDLDSVYKIYADIIKSNLIVPKGIYTHFPNAINEKETNIQFDRFLNVIKKLEEKGINVGLRHVCASTSFLKYPKMWLDAVRLGSCIQGRVLVKKDIFKKVGLFKTTIEEIKAVPKGYKISYGSIYTAKHDMKIAIISVGYQDGFNMKKGRDDFSFKNNLVSIGMEIKKLFKDNSLKVTINGKQYNVVGRLGMFYAVIDITNSKDIKEGDEVELNISPLQATKTIRRVYI